MTDQPYTPPRVWQWEQPSGGRFASINRPVAGPTHEAELPVGKHPHQLYSLGTPNGQKVTILFEELLEAGHADAEYDAWPIDIMKGEQFSTGFVAINPNSKIPALLDRSTNPPTRVFESGAILVYLAEKFGQFLPASGAPRAECLSWLFWQVGSAPYLGGGFGHFYAYAPIKLQYPIDRFAMEVKRQLDVLDRNLAQRRFMIGDEYTIADMAAYPWINPYDKAPLDLEPFPNLRRWHAAIAARPATQRAYALTKQVNPDAGKPLSEEERKQLFGR